ncbi:unnamed protein product [Brassica napus]|uniref:(rape) hypothetical protein n=1 Tax=Brassica napus TaxID=3708 RepID=A0A816QC72_BRANA|nr:unnamed protein product [Brassica napus]
MPGDEDYDYNLWHDFVGTKLRIGTMIRMRMKGRWWWSSGVTYGGVRSGSSTNKQCTANPPSTFEDYVDEGRDYIGSSRISMENIEEASNNLGVKSSDQVADTSRIIQIQIKKRTQVWTTAPKCLAHVLNSRKLEYHVDMPLLRLCLGLAALRVRCRRLSKKAWNETTKGVTLPVPDPQDLFIPSEVSDLIMLPPKAKRPPGRPPTKRKRSAGEIPVRPNLI